MKTDTRQWVTMICVLAGSFGAGAQTTVSDALVVTEFFEGFRWVDPSGPDTSTLYQNPVNTPANVWPRELLLEPAGTLLFTDSSLLRRFDPATGIITDVAEPSEKRLESLAFEPGGTLVANDSDHVYRIDPASGQITLIPNTETFYSPRRVTVTPNGDIYINEFYDGLRKIDPVTLQFSPVPGSGGFGIAKLIEALPSGDLAILTFQNDLLVFDPDTGGSTLVPFEIEGAARGSAIGSNGQLLLVSNSAVFEVDVLTGASTVLTPDETFLSPYDVVQGTMTILFDTDGDGDFDDSDLGTAFAKYTGPVGAAGEMTYTDGDVDGDGDVDDSDLGTLFARYSGPLSAPVPEPASAALIAVGLGAVVRRRRG